MPIVEKLLLAAGVGQGLYGKWRLQRLLSVAITVIMLAVVAAVLVSALLIAATIGAYFFFLSRGILFPDALYLTALVGLFFIASLFLLMRRCLRTLKSSVRTPLSDATDAFFDGLFAE